MIERKREISVMRWMIVLSFSSKLYSSTDLEAKKAFLEIWQEINYNYYTNPLICVAVVM
jgi:hypothetical protein